MYFDNVTLSVVIISWNQLAFLKRLVGQLLEQDYPTAYYEIIIVDDGSNDGSREWLATLECANVHVVFGQENRGRGASRNTGIRAAKYDIVVMIDGDHTISKDFLTIHADRHKNERCIIVGKSYFTPDREYRALNDYLNNGGAAKLPKDARLPGRYFLTRNCSAPRDLLMEVGLFDESFVAWGGEDLDLGVRLEKSGVPIYGESRALALHHHHRNLRDLMHQMHVYGRDSIPILLKRHPSLFYELNLDRTLTSNTNPSRFPALYRMTMRMLFAGVFYSTIFRAVHYLRRHHLPRILLDYLHLRQYTLGYREYLKKTRAVNGKSD